MCSGQGHSLATIDKGMATELVLCGVRPCHNIAPVAKGKAIGKSTTGTMVKVVAAIDKGKAMSREVGSCERVACQGHPRPTLGHGIRRSCGASYVACRLGGFDKAMVWLGEGDGSALGGLGWGR